MDAAFTHWEKASVSTWYCKKEELSVAPGYQFHDAWDFKSMAANTSFIYFNHEKLKNYYVDCALQYMRDNVVNPKKRENPELIFVEQRLLTMCLAEWKRMDHACPLIDIVWDGQKGCFERTQALRNGWRFFDFDNQSIATHTWIAKAMIDKNDSYRAYMCCRLIELILKEKHHLYDKLIKIEPIRKYLKLLEQYQSTSSMVSQKVVDRELYGGKK